MTSILAPKRLDVLQPAAIAFAGAVLLHNADHARRGGSSVTADLFAAGVAAMLLEVAVVVLVLQRHRLAPAVSATAGFSLAVGYVVAHALPPRGWLSDPLFTGRGDLLSQAAAVLEIVAALTLGIAGALTSRGAAEPGTVAARSLGETLREPVAAGFIVGNVVILMISLITR